MDDSEISAGVLDALEDSALRKYDIGVTTEEGVVTLSGEVVVLSGTVPTETARDEAVKLAETVEGVTGVVSEIVVEGE